MSCLLLWFTTKMCSSTGTLTHSLFPPFKPACDASCLMLLSLMRLGWIGLYLLCSSRACNIAVKTLPGASYLRGSGYLGGQLRHQLSSSLLYQEHGRAPLTDCPAEISQCPYLSLLAACLTVFSWQLSTRILDWFWLFLAAVRSEGAATERHAHSKPLVVGPCEK